MAAKWWRSGGGATVRTLASLSSSESASVPVIQACPREVIKGRAAARDRALGRIPAMVFNQSDPESESTKHLVTTHWKQIAQILESVKLPFFCSTRFPIQIRPGYGSSLLLHSGNVLPVKVIRDKSTGFIWNIDFVWANEGTKLEVNVPVVFKGEDVCPGLKNGGNLKLLRSSLKYLCLAEHIQSMIEVDVSNLNIGDQILVHDVDVNPSLKLLTEDEEVPVCEIVSTMPENQVTE